jgi:hypothetical protein
VYLVGIYQVEALAWVTGERGVFKEVSITVAPSAH